MAETLTQLNQKRWAVHKVLANKTASFDKVAAKLTAPNAMKHYKAVEAKTGVPWWFIAVVHYRESSQNFAKSLAQGDPWNQVSTHVPKGRGPFKSWEEAAVDALTKCSPYAARNKDWSIGGALTMLEKYNGLGYYRKGLPSPYIWAGTDQYSKGKYVADGVFSASTVDTQLGVAGLLDRMGVFKKPSPVKDNATATSILALITGYVTAVYQWGQDHLALVAVGTVAAALGLWGLVKLYRKIKNAN